MFLSPSGRGLGRPSLPLRCAPGRSPKGAGTLFAALGVLPETHRDFVREGALPLLRHLCQRGLVRTLGVSCRVVDAVDEPAAGETRVGRSTSEEALCQPCGTLARARRAGRMTTCGSPSASLASGTTATLSPREYPRSPG